MIAHIRNICNNKKFSYQTLEFRPPLNIKYNYTFTTFFDKLHLGPTILSFSKIHKHIISIWAHIPLIERNYVNLTQFLSAHSVKPPRQFQPQVIHSLFLRLFGAAFCQVKVYRRADQRMLLAIGEAIAVQQISLLSLG